MSNTGLRTRILERISDQGMQTSSELAEFFGVDRKTILDSTRTARDDGYLASGRDDVTGTLGYTLTAKGKARVANGRLTVGSGKRAAENVADESVVDNRIDIVGQNGNSGEHNNTAKSPIGFAVMKGPSKIFTCESDARKFAVEVLKEIGTNIGPLHVVSILATTDIQVGWK